MRQVGAIRSISGSAVKAAAPTQHAAQAAHAAQEDHDQQVDASGSRSARPGRARRRRRRRARRSPPASAAADRRRRASGTRSGSIGGRRRPAVSLSRTAWKARPSRNVVRPAIEQTRPGPGRRAPSSRRRAAWRCGAARAAGLGMPVTQSGPRVKSTQLVATIWVTSAKPSVPIAKLCSVSRNIGTPTASATSAGQRDAGGQRGREGPAGLGGEEGRRVGADAEEGGVGQREAADVADHQVVAQRQRPVERGEDRARAGRSAAGRAPPPPRSTAPRPATARPARQPARRARSDPDPPAEEPLRPHEQHRHHDHERDGVLVGVGDVAAGERLGDADQEARPRWRP